jgi:hypothetical protein
LRPKDGRKDDEAGTAATSFFPPHFLVILNHVTYRLQSSGSCICKTHFLIPDFLPSAHTANRVNNQTHTHTNKKKLHISASPRHNFCPEAYPIPNLASDQSTSKPLAAACVAIPNHRREVGIIYAQWNAKNWMPDCGLDRNDVG